MVDEKDKSNVDHIYAIGDNSNLGAELTPVAI